jgi:hypothetical protein
MGFHCVATPPVFPMDDFTSSMHLYSAAMSYRRNRPLPMPCLIKAVLSEWTPREKAWMRSNEARARYLKKRQFTAWNAQFRIVGLWSWARVFRAPAGLMGAKVERTGSLKLGERNMGLP